MSTQTRTQWSPAELKKLYAWLIANKPEGTNIEKINAAQNAVIATTRIRMFETDSAAKTALRRINEVAAPVGVDTTVALGAPQSITVHAEPSSTELKVTREDLARLLPHLKLGTKIELV